MVRWSLSTWQSLYENVQQPGSSKNFAIWASHFQVPVQHPDTKGTAAVDALNCSAARLPRRNTCHLFPNAGEDEIAVCGTKGGLDIGASEGHRSDRGIDVTAGAIFFC